MADSAPKDKDRSMDIVANRMRRALLKEENQDLFTEYKNCKNSEKKRFLREFSAAGSVANFRAKRQCSEKSSMAQTRTSTYKTTPELALAMNSEESAKAWAKKMDEDGNTATCPIRGEKTYLYYAIDWSSSFEKHLSIKSTTVEVITKIKSTRL